MNNKDMINLINNYLSTIKEKDIPYTLDSWIFQAKQNVEVHKKILKHNLKVKIDIEKELFNLQQSELFLVNLLIIKRDLQGKKDSSKGRVMIKLKRFIKKLFGYIPYWECKCKKRCSWFFDSGFIVCTNCGCAKEVYIKKVN